jgi:nucleotide-binding universal stress UspA family protein
MFHRILVPVDGSGPAEAGLLEALALASAHHSSIALLHVIDDAPWVDDLSNAFDRTAAHQAARARGQLALDEARCICEYHGLQAESHLVGTHLGAVSDALFHQAAELGCDLIAMGSHGRRGLRRGIAVTLNPALALTMDWLARLRNGGAWILQSAAERGRAAGLGVETLLVDDFNHRVWNVVAEDASRWLADVIVLGSHGRRGAERLFIGSDAEQIVRHAPVPVLMVRNGLGAVQSADRPAQGLGAPLAPGLGVTLR